jgi:sugar phosphate isomerase/epimerase
MPRGKKEKAEQTTSELQGVEAEGGRIPTPRREFIRRSTGLSLAALGLSARAAEAAPSGLISRLRTSLNAYSFYVELNRGLKEPNNPKAMSLRQLLAFTAEAGFDAIDLTAYFFASYPKPPPDAEVFAIKHEAFRLGLEISGSGVKNEITTADKALRAEGKQRIKDWVEVCLKLGAPVLRVFADTNIPPQKWQVVSGGAPRDVVEGWIADDFRECAEFAAQHGIFIGVQNHGDFLTTGVEHVSLLKRVDHPNCRAIVDTGKYLTVDPYSDMAVAAPLAVNWQIKETPFGKPNKPLTDMRKIVRIARDANYNGYLPIESLPMGRTNYDTPGELRRMLKELKAAIAE